MTESRPGEFSVTVGVGGGQAALSVRGDVDLLTAPTLAAALDVLVGHRHPRVVLDLAELTFMDASGMDVIADASARLVLSGGVLSIRSASAQTLRILEITGVRDLVELEGPMHAAEALGLEQRSGDHSFAVASSPASLSSDLARVRATTTNSDVIDAALRLVTALASATVEGVDGVSVSLERHGKLTTVAATDDTVKQMDRHQYATGEGPCLSAAAEGHWFHVQSLADDDRWPIFRPLALEEGIASILSTPLVAAGLPMGALNMYSNSERVFGPRQQELAALFATQASGILIDAAAEVTDDQLGARILEALLAREVISQAQGMLMAGRGLTADDASATLHRSARAAAIPVQRFAREVVAGVPARNGAIG